MRSRRSPSRTSSAVRETRARAGLRRPRATLRHAAPSERCVVVPVPCTRRARRPQRTTHPRHRLRDGTACVGARRPGPREGLGRRSQHRDASRRTGARPARCRRASGSSRSAAVSRRMVRACDDVARRPPRRPPGGLRRGPPGDRDRGRFRDRHLRPRAFRGAHTGSTPCFRGSPRSTARAFPPERLSAELEAAGFESVRSVLVSSFDELDRETALERIRGRHISTFDLLDEDEIDEGTQRAEAELPDLIVRRFEQLVVVAA